MAHIPPARDGDDSELAATGEDLINEYLKKTYERVDDADLEDPMGYLLTSSFLTKDLQNKLRYWFDNKDIKDDKLTVKVYSPDDPLPGSGNLAVSREARDYSPRLASYKRHNIKGTFFFSSVGPGLFAESHNNHTCTIYQGFSPRRHMELQTSCTYI
ncbi:hypothetical protein F5X98DRAFT_373430 [Xylaria grammica]|nr:hypothetical protein F5X98DRAFT_373430 [Xylaria grammica]